MNYILFDTLRREHLLPLTFIRPSADIRIGILTIREKWEQYLNTKTSSLTESYLQEKFPLKSEEQNILLNGTICPNPTLVKEIHDLKRNEALVSGEIIIAMHIMKSELDSFDEAETDVKEIQSKATYTKINNTWDIFAKNGDEIKADFDLLTKGRKSQKIASGNHVIGEENIFVEEGAIIQNASLNASTGPIYIGKDSEIMEGSLVRGPFALCEKSTLKMGAKIYGPSTIGPDSKVGGELSNVVIFGLSNKGHDGFLGNAVIGEWCNIGADSNNSNLKNTYEEVKIWDYAENSFVKSGLQFCGLIMGDHSKCGINTMFNTGTVIGVHANIFGDGFQRNFIPSFSWGGNSKMEKYNFERAMQVTSAVFERRSRTLDQSDIAMLKLIYEKSVDNRFV